jgi:cytochrome d ubiquinol oxidase subunit II
MFPIPVSTTDRARNLTAYDASSTPKTLRIMLVIAAVGLPLELGYTVGIYRVFRGKVTLAADRY